MGYRTQPDGGAKTLAELGLTGTAEEINHAAAAVADKNEPGGAVILDEDGKVPAANLPASAPAPAFTITAMGYNTTASSGGPSRRFIAINITANSRIFLTLEGDQPPERINVVSRTLSGTKGFTVEAMYDVSFNWMVVEPAS